jgi:mRNA-degrading endonuclease YafQ of YafQ-DinJ toxin-antitoxin module
MLMYEILYKPVFIKKYRKLELALKEEVREKIELLRDRSNHSKLKVHKLQGKFSMYWSFSVNYKVRIFFIFEGKNRIAILNIGDHDIYK